MHYTNNWDELDAILIWTGDSDFGACEPTTCQLYQEDIGPYALPLADPGQPTFMFPHLQLQLHDMQQLLAIYAAMPDPTLEPSKPVSKK